MKQKKMMHRKRGCHRSKGADCSSDKEGKSERKEDRNIAIRKRKSEHEKKGCWYQKEITT